MRTLARLLVLGLMTIPTFGASAWADPPDPAPTEAPPPDKTTDDDTGLEGADEPAVVADAMPTLVRGLSWDMMAGGIPKSGALAEVQLGFPGLVRAAYHYTLSPGFSIGGLVAFDYAYYRPSAAWDSSLILAVPIRYTLFRRETVSAAVRAEPGIQFAVDGLFRLGLLANVGAVIGWTIENRFVIGIAADVPLALVIPESGTVALAVPILVGGIAEMHLSPPLAVTFEAKIGPALNTVADTVLALEILVGATYRL